MSDLPLDLTAVLHDARLLESLAAVEHERWSHWQRYLHSQCQRRSDGSLTIPPEMVDRWSAQASTPYADLTDAEKESDRDQVRRYLPVIADTLRGLTSFG